MKQNDRKNCSQAMNKQHVLSKLSDSYCPFCKICTIRGASAPKSMQYLTELTVLADN